MTAGKTLLIFGSRCLKGAQVRELIVKSVELIKPSTIGTSLHTRGVCAEARKYVEIAKNGIDLKCYTLNAARAQGQYEARSIKAIQEAEHILFIWDGRSKGTKNEIDLAVKYSKHHDIHILEPVADDWTTEGLFQVDDCCD